MTSRLRYLMLLILIPDYALSQPSKESRWVAHYCPAHPGEKWQWINTANGAVIGDGLCPTLDGQIISAVNHFIAKHRDYVPEGPNSEAMTAYIQQSNLDPREESSYERAYKDLKKEGRLHLYAK